jgi:hypothetical protein
MTYLRFSPEEYCSLCQLCRPLPPGSDDLAAFKRYLVAALADTQPGLAERIVELDGHQLGILYDHFHEGGPYDEGNDARHGLTPQELRVVAEACRSFRFPVRFVRLFKGSLAHHLGEVFPALAGKLSRLSDSEFEGLYEQVQGRRKGNA